MIFPLLEEAHRRLGHRFDKAIIEHRKGTQIRIDNSRRIFLLLRKLKPEDFSIEEGAGAITLHLEYLTLVEGLFATQINFLIFTLIANGHDLYSTRKGRYVRNIADIEEVNLAFRLRFLREHGFEIVANGVDIQLRNGVAHLFYEIYSSGTIKVGKKRITQAEYDRLYEKLRNVSYALDLVNLIYYRRFA